MRSILPLVLLLSACPSEEPQDPAAEIPDLSGDYTLVFAQAGTRCYPPDYLFVDLFAFLDDVEDGTPVSAASFAQEGTQLAITLHSSDCVLEGGVGEGGSFNVLGSCDDALMNREVSIDGDAARSGVSGWRIEALSSFDIDQGDGAGGGPDGVVDCVVNEVTVTGSGAPTD